MSINGSVVLWTNKIKYLGLTLLAGRKWTIDLSETRRKFFASVNSIFSKCKYTSDLVKLELVERHCLPILLFAIESLVIKGDQMNSVNSWWNSVYRKIFGYNKWESVKEVICLTGRLDVKHIVNLRRLLFIKRLIMSHNSAMSGLMYIYSNSPEIVELQRQYKIDVFWSRWKIKTSIYNDFSMLVNS